MLTVSHTTAPGAACQHGVAELDEAMAVCAAGLLRLVVRAVELPGAGHAPADLVVDRQTAFLAAEVVQAEHPAIVGCATPELALDE
ncbi:MAG: hypothetical protein ABL907_22245, partial [Hyphomicrobium sp.]